MSAGADPNLINRTAAALYRAYTESMITPPIEPETGKPKTWETLSLPPQMFWRKVATFYLIEMAER